MHALPFLHEPITGDAAKGNWGNSRLAYPLLSRDGFICI